MRTRLNLATKPLLTHRRFLLASGITGAVAAIFFIGLGWHVYSVRKANEAQRVKMADIRKELVGLEERRKELEAFFALPANSKLHDRSAFLNTLIDQESLNWTRMFMDIEHILPGGVRVVSIEPKLEKGRVDVKLVVAAINDEAKMKFLSAMEKSRSFSDVQLTSEKPPTQGSDHAELELQAVYSGT